jgi:predicted lysophospholipase L1 biosynthesis ABC-type transport system permease subunit
MTLYPLYIDPGTGSMLFSILIGAAATVFFVFRALLIKAKIFFFRRRPRRRGKIRLSIRYLLRG